MICFVTNEITPGRRGGIGFYIEEAMAVLESEGLQTCLLVTNPDIDTKDTERHLRSVGISGAVFDLSKYERKSLPDDVPVDAFRHSFYAASYYTAQALDDICRTLPVTCVEFIDYGGFGFAAIRRKRVFGDFADQLFAVRIHTTSELLQAAEERRYGSRNHLLRYFMEGYAIRHADALFGSTPSVIEEYDRFYRREGCGIVCPLPVRKLTEKPLPVRPAKKPPCSIVHVGSCTRVKGSDLFVEAALRLINKGFDDVKFVLMGRDRPSSVRFGSYVEEVRRLVPRGLQNRFEFRASYYGPRELLRAAEGCSFAVLPSRWEAFSLVAHELRWLGTPLVLSPIPAFMDCFEQGKDAVFFDGTAGGLADVMEALLTGQSTLTGREDISTLCVDSSGFADVYRRQIERTRPQAVEFRGDKPPVSVVIAHREDAKSLRDSVRSVLASSYGNLEVLIVDGIGASSPAREALGPLNAETQIAHGHRVEFLGPCTGERAAAYNMALERAAGSFVCCLEEGYVVSEKYIQLAVEALQRCPEAAFISCFQRVHETGATSKEAVRVETPYGLDPVLITVEDGAGLRNAVFRRDELNRLGQCFKTDLYAFAAWELGWSLAELGLTSEVLPQVHVICRNKTDEWAQWSRWLAQYHLRQMMAKSHPRLIVEHPSDILKAHLAFTPGPAEEVLTDLWLLQNYRGLRLLRVGMKKCIREGPRALLSHFLGKARDWAKVWWLRHSRSKKRQPRRS